MKKLSAERLSVLKKYGFNDNLNCEFSYIFSSYCALDTKLLVQGSHATDHAYIHYACVNTDSGEQCEGLFYSSSLLEYLLTDFYGEWNFEAILKKIQKQLDSKVQLVSINAYPYFYIKINEPNWKEANIAIQISDILKLIAQLDYFLPKEKEYLIKKRLKNNK